MELILSSKCILSLLLLLCTSSRTTLCWIGEGEGDIIDIIFFKDLDI